MNYDNLGIDQRKGISNKTLEPRQMSISNIENLEATETTTDKRETDQRPNLEKSGYQIQRTVMTLLYPITYLYRRLLF